MITAIDHIVLSVTDPDETIRFYCDGLGMELQLFTPPAGGPSRKALIFGQQKINLHDAAAPYAPHARQPVAGAGDLCFLSALPLADWLVHLAARNIEVESGPVPRTGATGPLMSIYLRDPDGNLIEIANQP
ncbi:MAG: VOC family virulence protein [Rhodospirillaceae bacterium]|mgnify:FL=1|nr:VOC family virulence protein [Rhodospirillaceae bacterium]